MKKYKLIKEFPDSPSIGAVAEFQERDNNYSIKSQGFWTRCYRYSKRTVEEMPEFWQKVEPLFITENGSELYEGDQYFTVFFKECGIEMFKVHGPFIWNEEKNGEVSENCKFFASNKSAEKWIEENKPKEEKKWEILEFTNRGLHFHPIKREYKINKVKRLSDGETFQIGDLIRVLESHQQAAEPVLKIELNKENNICLFTHTFGKNGVSIHKAKKEKEVETKQYKVEIDDTSAFGMSHHNHNKHRVSVENLSHKEALDIKEKFEKIVNKERSIQLWYGVDNDWHTMETRIDMKQLDVKTTIHWFKTKEERDRYIRENKPMYSERELKEFALFFESSKRVQFNTEISYLFNSWIKIIKER